LDVSLEKRYPVAADVTRAWQVLADVQAVARCMPGAELTEQLDATHFKGVVKVKVGPVTAQFAGELELLALDVDTHTLRLRGKGSDKSGSTATLDLTAQLQAAAGDAATLIGHAHVILNGRLVQMAGRMIVPVAETILAQFVGNFSNAAAAIPLVETLPQVDAATAELPSPAASRAAPPSPAPPPARELKVLAVLWSVVRHWFATRLGRRA
jgi:carbon monoxide dehydrogenase subunit G